ncbi:MAG: helix-turn-helix transcriptional regulator [Planctomycetes bacterium]|nr:helix-turn-helix transcriptional regulator [Planctomycetota bacterium]
MNYFQDIHFLHGNCGTQTKGTIHLAHRDYYCLQYNHAGRIRVQVGDEPERLVSGPSLLLTFPGSKLAFGTGTTDTWHHDYVAFNGPRVQDYVASDLLPIHTPVHQILNGEHFLLTFTDCVRALKRGPEGNAAAAHALEGLLLQLHEESAGHLKEGRLEAGIHQLADRIRAEPMRDWEFRAEAETLHVSYGHLRRVFRQVTGSAPGHLLLNARLAHAAELLAQSDGEIKEVAAAVGIPDIHYFTKLFRCRYHVPPGRFRRELRGT